MRYLTLADVLRIAEPAVDVMLAVFGELDRQAMARSVTDRLEG